MKKIILILFLTFVYTEYNNPNGKPGLLTVSFNVLTEHKPNYTRSHPLNHSTNDIVTTIILPINSYLTVKGSLGPDRWEHYHNYNPNSGNLELEGEYFLRYSYGLEIHAPIYKIFQ
tara:strand:- start:305 stop:652 length:348 start_codon:yes stop_codon:yes gene_type:complete